MNEHDADCRSCNYDYRLPVEAVAAHCDEGNHPVVDTLHLHDQNGRRLCVNHLAVCGNEREK